MGSFPKVQLKLNDFRPPDFSRHICSNMARCQRLLSNAVYVCPRDRAEVAPGRFNAHLFLKFYEGTLGQGAKSFCRAVSRKSSCCQTAVLCNKKLLKLLHVASDSAEL